MDETDTPINHPQETVFEKINAYAEKESANGFTWVYRAEGDPDPKHASGGRTNLAGTWFSPSFLFAKGQIRQLIDKKIPNPHLVAMVIPKSILDQRDSLQKGMQEINIIFRNQIRVRPVEEELDKKPDAKMYVDQFDKELLTQE